jgi:hypothetical protein
MAWKKSAFKHSQTFRFFAQGSRAKNYLRQIQFYGYALNNAVSLIMQCGPAGA